MTGLIPDVNIEGPVLAVVARLGRPDLAELWDDLKLTAQTFGSLGWPTDLPDREVWRRCQAAGLVLLTDNRNNDGADSLEATIRDSAAPDSLPVLTISDKDSLQADPAYAERVATDLLDLLSDMLDWGRYLGAGRVYLPLS